MGMGFWQIVTNIYKTFTLLVREAELQKRLHVHGVPEEEKKLDEAPMKPFKHKYAWIYKEELISFTVNLPCISTLSKCW